MKIGFLKSPLVTKLNIEGDHAVIRFAARPFIGSVARNFEVQGTLKSSLFF
jgi:hypothetical protein